MDTVILILSLSLIALFLLRGWFRGKQAALKLLPPGPPSLPLVGNLHMLGKLPHRSLNKMAARYGAIMFLRLGSVPTVVASSPEAAKQFLKIQDMNFASRPFMSFAHNVVYGSKGVAFSSYGPYWRQLRKIFTTQLLSPKRIDSFRFIREQETRAMVDELVRHCGRDVQGSSPVNVSKLAAAVTNNMNCRMAFGRKYSEEELDNRGFKEMIQEVFFLSGAFNVGDFIPWLQWMDIQGLVRRQKEAHKTFDAFIEKIIGEHQHVHLRGEGSDFNPDFVDELLALTEIDEEHEMKITRETVKAVIFDILVAGSDTSTVAVEWAMSEILLNPWIAKNIREELERVVGGHRKYVEESDLGQLEYLAAVVKETLRVHPPVPLLIPHECIEDCTVSGYDIPSKCRVIVNIWAIARDPAVWEDADAFKPERFVGNPIDVRGQNFEVLPFGSGRRGCPGQLLGVTVVQLVLANLLHCFQWRLPDGMKAEDLDMVEEFGLSTPRTHHLFALPTPRQLHV
uniref:CYP736C8 n=1 Tax=Taxus chinensis TaxID=29808 RepID=A0A291FAZ4_TAXCH|nr:CYP736C8 [Taxus chinensis]